MKILVLHAHPVESSYGRALYHQTLESLSAAGHEIDSCDLYAENFDPVLQRHGRIIYHDYPENTELVQGYVERLNAAEGLVIVTPVWNFGWPAILKGYFDRVWLPGVSFELTDGKMRSRLRHIQKLGAVLTYGATPMRAFLSGNPPKKIVKRVLWAQTSMRRPATFLAHYDMNNCTDQTRAAFLARVRRSMMRF
jgi:NAD(P)H dehydrogenase (quinone)